MIFWSLMLHFYQPPTQVPAIVKKVVEESYRPLLRLFRRNRGMRLTININGSLTEILDELNFSDVLADLGELSDEGVVEFTGSGKYHPILPLIPAGEIKRQIELNYETNSRLIGPSYRESGFFPPEMCFGRDILDPLIEKGYRWLIISGVGCPNGWPVDVVYETRGSRGKIPVIFRDDFISNLISFGQIRGGKDFIQSLRTVATKHEKKNIYIVTAMDAETFGHHIRGWDEKFLDTTICEIKQQTVDYEWAPQPDTPNDMVKPIMVSDVLDNFSKCGIIQPLESSWSTTKEDLKNGNSYPLWKTPENYIHQLQWDSLNLALETVWKAVEVADNDEARRHAGLSRQLMDKALHSDQMWWASCRPWLDVNLISNGLSLHEKVFLNAYKAIRLSGINELVKKQYYYKVVAGRERCQRIMDSLMGIDVKAY